MVKRRVQDFLRQVWMRELESSLKASTVIAIGECELDDQDDTIKFS